MGCRHPNGVAGHPIPSGARKEIPDDRSRTWRLRGYFWAACRESLPM